MIKVRIERAWSQAGWNLWILEYLQNATWVWKPLLVERELLKEGELLPPPTLFLDQFMGKELVTAARLELAGLDLFSKEELETHAKVERAMQAHIDSLKFIVEKKIK